ncbi:Na+/H+ antiporter NhaA [Streptomyces sp. MNU76]|uniref:Na+/H+ antiporter NhaA n=1 Tax=Streptomyces sp. MNU76 TaxID=2560026 RepID=UPI0027E02041|nr:Na+/H+ antiporter NhaA [Streptomyces sp. MNU76]
MTSKGQGAAPPPFLALLPGSERRSLAEILRAETFGGLVLLAAALIALVWANSPLADSYESPAWAYAAESASAESSTSTDIPPELHG